LNANVEAKSSWKKAKLTSSKRMNKENLLLDKQPCTCRSIVSDAYVELISAAAAKKNHIILA
jgi:hypothetical protein